MHVIRQTREMHKQNTQLRVLSADNSLLKITVIYKKRECICTGGKHWNELQNQIYILAKKNMQTAAFLNVCRMFKRFVNWTFRPVYENVHARYITGGKHWNELQKEVSVICSKGTSGNSRGHSKG